MKGEDKSSQQENEGNANPPSVPNAVEPGHPEPPTPDRASVTYVEREDGPVHTQISQQQIAETKVLSEIKKTEWISIELAAGIFLTGAIGGFIFYLQLGEMKKANESTRILVDAAKTQADAAKVQANAAAGALEDARNASRETTSRAERATLATENAARSMARQADTSKRSASAAEGSAQAALDAARAYISIEDCKMNPPVAGQSAFVDMSVANNGNSPGEINGWAKSSVVDSLDEPPDMSDTPGGQPIRDFTVEPHQNRLERMVLAPFNENIVKGIMSKPPRFFLVFSIKATYRTLGGTFPFESCFYYSPGHFSPGDFVQRACRK